jgi:hypothetical protein
MSHVYKYEQPQKHVASHRILELELTHDWLGALMEYGVLHNGTSFTTSFQHLTAASSALSSSSSAREARYTAPYDSTATRSAGSAGSAGTAGTAGAVMSSPSPTTSLLPQLPLDEIAQMERRKFRCLIELGHFESVVDQVSCH